MPSILIGIDENAIITEWNKEAEEKMGKKNTDVVGRNIVEIVPSMKKHMKKIEKSIATGNV